MGTGHQRRTVSRQSGDQVPPQRSCAVNRDRCGLLREDLRGHLAEVTGPGYHMGAQHPFLSWCCISISGHMGSVSFHAWVGAAGPHSTPCRLSAEFWLIVKNLP